MSEFQQQNPQIDPTQTSGPEITRQQILNASADEIRSAAENEAARLASIQADYTMGGMEWKHAQSLINDAQRTALYALGYGQRETRYDSFGQYLSEKIADEDAADRLEPHLQVQTWFEGPAAERAISDVLRSKSEQPAAVNPSPAQPETQTIDPQAEAAQQRQFVDEARQTVEQARSVELLDTIVKLGKNQTLLETDIMKGFIFIGDGGKQNDRFMYMQNLDELCKRDTKAIGWQEELNEVAMFSDVVEQDTQTVTTEHVTTGRLGRTHKTESTSTEVVPGSEHPKLIRNEITGQDEPAVRFRYRFMYGIKTSQQDGLPKYREFGGYRGGQHVHASVELPKSVADELQEQVRQNPSTARAIAEKLFLSNSDGTMTEEFWRSGREGVNHPIRPPYEQLPTDWTVAVVTAQETEHNGRPNTLNYAIERVPINATAA